MKKRVKAKISWVPKNKGGRESPPPGPRYITVSRFEEDKDSYPKEAWSLVLEFSRLPDSSLDLIADVGFLMDDAPNHLLHPGSKFELFEGRQLVAKGEVM
jgi:hypothetical protein